MFNSTLIQQEIKSCKTWEDLYNKIKSNPVKYNVHFCLVNCDDKLICNSLFVKLITDEILDIFEPSIYYDDLINNNIRPPGHRTIYDYIVYLGDVAYNKKDNDSIVRLAAAWSTPYYLNNICNEGLEQYLS